MPLRTPDGRYIVVAGRLWRASNPALSSDALADYTRALMAARRAVQLSLRSGDHGAERLARRRVQAAKVHLGERGPVWWDDGSPDLNRRLIANTPYAGWWASIREIRAKLLELVEARAPGASVCPSEVARTVSPRAWRPLMTSVRDVARELMREGFVVVTQRGEELSAEEQWVGPVRISRQASPPTRQRARNRD